jgi:hypothetical protein
LPAKRPIRYADYYDYRNQPKSILQQRRLLRRALLEMDDHSVGLCYSLVIWAARESQTRVDLAELARIRAGGAIVIAQTVPANELRFLKPKRRARP